MTTTLYTDSKISPKPVNDDQLLGIGLYTASEASRLTSVPQASIRRWLLGYVRGSIGERQRLPPLWTPQIILPDQPLALGFRDLMEVRVVSALLTVGLSLQAVRKALIAAREMIGDERPLSTARFRTDGRGIFLEVAKEHDEPILIDLLKKQFGFKRIIDPSLADVDFEAGVSARWWPRGREKSVVIDPSRNFGQPIVDQGSVPTVALADAVAVEGSTKRVARLFGVSERAVHHAVSFEASLAA